MSRWKLGNHRPAIIRHTINRYFELITTTTTTTTTMSGDAMTIRRPSVRPSALFACSPCLHKQAAAAFKVQRDTRKRKMTRNWWVKGPRWVTSTKFCLSTPLRRMWPRDYLSFKIQHPPNAVRLSPRYRPGPCPVIIPLSCGQK